MKIQDIVYNRWNRMVIVSQFTQNWGGGGGGGER